MFGVEATVCVSAEGVGGRGGGGGGGEGGVRERVGVDELSGGELVEVPGCAEVGGVGEGDGGVAVEPEERGERRIWVRGRWSGCSEGCSETL